MQPKLRCLIFPALMSALTLGACTEVPNASDMPGDLPGVAVKLPESIVTMAGPEQDLATVRMMPEDGCLWYRHTGPVETTMLPLRTADGRPICTKVAS